MLQYILAEKLQVWPSKVKIHLGNLEDAKKLITAWLQNAPFTKYHLLRFNRGHILRVI